MSQSSAIPVIGIDIGKNSFHVVGLDDRGAIVLRQKWSRGQIEVRLQVVSTKLTTSQNVQRCAAAMMRAMMSAMGQKQTSNNRSVMSAIPPKADIEWHARNVR